MSDRERDVELVLLDLDGTLSDSAPGILSSLRAAFDEVGARWPGDVEARSLLGPPFWHTLPPLVGADRVDEVIGRYRQHYVDGGGMFVTRFYDGIPDALKILSDKGIRLAVATSKPEPHAVRIVEHLGLADWLPVVVGDTLDGGRDSKALVIGEALRRLGAPEPTRTLMVGDRKHDVIGAAAHDIRCVGALWGYGSATELTEAGADPLCGHPSELPALVD